MGTKTKGIGLGNFKNYTGIRFNIWDKRVQVSNGLSVAVKSQTKVKNGISIGLLYTEDSISNGLSLGIVGAVSKKAAGVSIAGIAAGGDRLSGVYIGGLVFANEIVRRVLCQHCYNC